MQIIATTDTNRYRKVNNELSINKIIVAALEHGLYE